MSKGRSLPLRSWFLMVTQIFPSWNQMSSWLSQLQGPPIRSLQILSERGLYDDASTYFSHLSRNSYAAALILEGNSCPASG